MAHVRRRGADVDKWQTTARNVATVIGGVAVYLSLRSLLDGGAFSAWWSIGPLFSITALGVALNLKTKRALTSMRLVPLFAISIRYGGCSLGGTLSS